MRIERPDVNADIIEIFEKEFDENRRAFVPVSIDEQIYKFTENKYGLWEPIDHAKPLTADVRWYISELISNLP